MRAAMRMEVSFEAFVGVSCDRPEWRRRQGWRLAALLLLMTSLTAVRTQAASLEYRVKAAFLYNFTQFVEWPPQAFAGPQAPYAICVLGEDPFSADLDAAAAEGTVRGRPVRVRRVAEPQAAAGCHILFVSSAERRRHPAVAAAMLAALGNAATLTVGEDEEFTRVGGGLRFFLKNDRVGVEINLDATDRARLKVSSKLLNLARVVRLPAPPPPKE